MWSVVLPVVALVFLVCLIWYLGGGQFGRAQTQAWIDAVRGVPWLHGFLNRHHGKFRASAHYVEFGGLFLVLYWLYDVFFGGGGFVFRWGPAVVIAAVSMVAAWLDEVHQLRSGTRQFRREDFLHSCCGISLAMALVFYGSLLRGVL